MSRTKERSSGFEKIQEVHNFQIQVKNKGHLRIYDSEKKELVEEEYKLPSRGFGPFLFIEKAFFLYGVDHPSDPKQRVSFASTEYISADNEIAAFENNRLKFRAKKNSEKAMKWKEENKLSVGMAIYCAKMVQKELKVYKIVLTATGRGSFIEFQRECQNNGIEKEVTDFKIMKFRIRTEEEEKKGCAELVPVFKFQKSGISEEETDRVCKIIDNYIDAKIYGDTEKIKNIDSQESEPKIENNEPDIDDGDLPF